jgi:hypothetical protein
MALQVKGVGGERLAQEHGGKRQMKFHAAFLETRCVNSVT